MSGRFEPCRVALEKHAGDRKSGIKTMPDETQMRVQIASDLHLEFEANREYIRSHPLAHEGSVLLLAGDIVPDHCREKADDFYAEIREFYPLIITVPGNHEFYQGTVDYAFPSYRKELAANHLLLNNQTVRFGICRFIVSTLWPDLPENLGEDFLNRMNDLRCIRRKEAGEKVPLTLADLRRFNAISRRFIRKELAEPFPGKTVLMTHFVPSPQLLAGLEDGFLKSYLSGGLELSGLKGVDLCVYGHHHRKFDRKIGNTRFTCNPLGYCGEGEGEGFNADCVIELGNNV